MRNISFIKRSESDFYIQRNEKFLDRRVACKNKINRISLCAYLLSQKDKAHFAYKSFLFISWKDKFSTSLKGGDY